MSTWVPCSSSQVRSAASRVLAPGANTEYISSTRKLDVASRQNDASANQAPTPESLASVIVTAPAATSVHGCAMAATTAAVHGDIVSSLASQAGAVCGRSLPRHCTAAIAISTMPSASLAISSRSAGAVRSRSGLPWVISSTTAITRTRLTSQPRIQPRPFLVPSLLLRIRMNADTRKGCRAIPRPMTMRSATTPHLPAPSASERSPVRRWPATSRILEKGIGATRTGLGIAARG